MPLITDIPLELVEIIDQERDRALVSPRMSRLLRRYPGVPWAKQHDLPVTIAPVTFVTGGSGTYNIPQWANFVDIIALGGGGGSGGTYGGNTGQGGGAGGWGAWTIQKGVTFPTGGIWTIGITIGGGGGTGAINSGASGGAGGPTYASVSGVGNYVAGGGAGGAGATGSANYFPGSGAGPGTLTYRSIVYNPATYGSYGYGGSCPAPPSAGGVGVQGIIWFVARQS